MLPGQTSREESTMPWGCLVGAPLRQQSDSALEGVRSCSVSLHVNPPLSGTENLQPKRQALTLTCAVRAHQDQGLWPCL